MSQLTALCVLYVLIFKSELTSKFMTSICQSGEFQPTNFNTCLIRQLGNVDVFNSHGSEECNRKLPHAPALLWLSLYVNLSVRTSSFPHKSNETVSRCSSAKQIMKTGRRGQ